MSKSIYTILFLLSPFILIDPIHGNELEKKVIQWRRHIHQYPELSDQEVNTAKYITEILDEYKVPYVKNIARNGIVAFIEGIGDKVVALRADMDALPVEEKNDLPFASKQKGIYKGEEVSIMHACGHDTHVAMLLGAMVKLLELQKNKQLAGSVLLIFQPSEEGSGEHEEFGAKLMLKEGAFSKFKKPQAIFGIHSGSGMAVHEIGLISGPAYAASDSFNLVINGTQAHGSTPWKSKDPILMATNIIQLSQQIISRKTNLLKTPAVLTFGSIHGGIRSNIIPDKVELRGTIRTFDEGERKLILDEFQKTIESVTKLAGGSYKLNYDLQYPVTINNPELFSKMQSFFPQAKMRDKITGSEDFSYFAQVVPGFFLQLGVTPKNVDIKTAPTNHSPYFIADESALMTGVDIFITCVTGFFSLKN